MAFRDTVDVTFGQWPNRILLGDHLNHKIFKFTLRFVVWHEPYADTWRRLDDRAGVSGSPG